MDEDKESIDVSKVDKSVWLLKVDMHLPTSNRQYKIIDTWEMFFLVNLELQLINKL